MKPLSFRKEIESWDENPTIKGTIEEFSSEPFEIVRIKTESGYVWKPIGYSNLEIVKSIPAGTEIEIRRGDLKKNKKSGRKFYEFKILVPDDFDELLLTQDNPF